MERERSTAAEERERQVPGVGIKCGEDNTAGREAGVTNRNALLRKTGRGRGGDEGEMRVSEERTRHSAIQ